MLDASTNGKLTSTCITSNNLYTQYVWFVFNIYDSTLGSAIMHYKKIDLIPNHSNSQMF